MRTWTLVRLQERDRGHRWATTQTPADQRLSDLEYREVIELDPVLDLLERINRQGPMLKIETAADVATLLMAHGRLP